MSFDFKKLKISIITINLNNKAGLKRTIKSVKDQTFKNIEYIIVDGDSSDGSDELIAGHKKLLTKVIFQKSKGIYHAINIGLKYAQGDIVSLLHSGDTYSNKKVLDFVSKNFEKMKLDFLIGGTRIFKKNKIYRVYSLDKFKQEDLKYGMSPPHLSTFISGNLKKKIGPYSLNYKIVSDFNFFVKLFKINNLNHIFTKKNLVDMEHGGKSNQGLKSIYKITKEINMCLKNNKINSNNFFTCFRLFIKLKQLLNVKFIR